MPPYELSKRLQDLRIDVALLSEIYLKTYKMFFIPNYHFYRTDRFPGRNGGTAVAVRKDMPHNNVDQPTFVSIEDMGACIPTGNFEALLAAVYVTRTNLEWWTHH
jgi:hypothetical protein